MGAEDKTVVIIPAHRDAMVMERRMRLIEEMGDPKFEVLRKKVNEYKRRLLANGFVSMDHAARVMDEMFGLYFHDDDDPSVFRSTGEEFEALLFDELRQSPLARVVSLWWHNFQKMLWDGPAVLVHAEGEI